MVPSEIKPMNFSDALLSLESGHKLTRKGWNGKGMWVRKIDLYTDKQFQVKEIDPCEGTIMPTLALKSANNELIFGWRPTTPDMFANDWELVVDVMEGY